VKAPAATRASSKTNAKGSPSKEQQVWNRDPRRDANVSSDRPEEQHDRTDNRKVPKPEEPHVRSPSADLRKLCLNPRVRRHRASASA
jgi:hypothetical protein